MRFGRTSKCTTAFSPRRDVGYSGTKCQIENSMALSHYNHVTITDCHYVYFSNRTLFIFCRMQYSCPTRTTTNSDFEGSLKPRKRQEWSRKSRSEEQKRTMQSGLLIYLHGCRKYSRHLEVCNILGRCHCRRYKFQLIEDLPIFWSWTDCELAVFS